MIAIGTSDNLSDDVMLIAGYSRARPVQSNAPVSYVADRGSPGPQCFVGLS